ncbi:MAG: MBL fold metallo-hydrolase [Burkholderiales bacterium]
MVRANQLLYPQRKPVAPRPAATVLLLRDTPYGVEVLMTRRSLSASFAPGAYVFPGGVVDSADAQVHPQARLRPGQTPQQATNAVAAIRESFEELGLLLAYRADGSWADASDIARLDRAAPFAAQCQALDLTLAADQVHLLAHWTTDADLPKRFAVPFLVARMPPDQAPVADEAEQFEPAWVRPADALARHHSGSFAMIFPTIRTLERLQAYASTDAVLAACIEGQPLWTSCPRGGWLNGQEARYMEHDPPFGELQMVCPDSQLVHDLTWQSEAPVPLLKNLRRLTAANPGMMTGPGTNSYLVGTAATGYAVIDPGPNDPAHVQRLFEATCVNGKSAIHYIVCTHSHPDHFPGARPLQALCEGHGSKPPILGLPSAPTARPASQFAPDRALQHLERLVLAGNGEIHSLQVIHTPGHAANHLCLLLLEDGLLFSGDHILNGSTTVIDPPDGHMGDYLHALDMLGQACQQHAIEFIAPAHGYVMGQAAQAIAKLKAHRLQREAKIASAMQAQPDGTPAQWLPVAYADVPSALWPIAMRSLLAHVAHIQKPGPQTS